MESTTIDDALAAAKNAIVRVGTVETGKGRGFIVEARRRVPGKPGDVTSITDRLIITAAHCLPDLPPPHPGAYSEELTFLDLLGPLGAEPTVAAECCFVDPVGDVAVLRAPDSQRGLDDAYDALVEEGAALRVGTVTAECAAWLLTLTGEWQQCRVRVNEYGAGNTLVLLDPQEGNMPGTSGSPIVTADGCAVGVVSLGTTLGGTAQVEQYGQPRLSHMLPVWLITALTAALRETEEGV